MSPKSPANRISVPEEVLIVSAKHGDDDAFATLAAYYKRVLEKQIYLCNAPKFMEEDLFQDGLLGLFKAVKTYNGSSASFATYATTCIRNGIISGIRKYSRQISKTVSLTNVYDDETSPSAEEILLDSVRARALYDKVCGALSVYERTVFDMYLSDMPSESIAFVTGKSAKSTSNAIYRIKTKLKRIVREGQGAPTK